MIIAVDFDGILAQDTGQFPEIGPPNWRVIAFIRDLIEAGHEIILWTCRTDKALEDAITWCNDKGLKFSSINENAPSNIKQYIKMYPNGTRKVHADIYIDDHSYEFIVRVATYGYRTAINMMLADVKSILQWKGEQNG